MRKRVAILVWNNFVYDKRVMNVASFFSKNYDTTVLAAKTIAELPTHEKIKYQIYRIPLFSSLKKGKSNHNASSKLSNLNSIYEEKIKNNRLKLVLIEFINVIIYHFKLLKYFSLNKPDLIYCNDLDTLDIGYLISKLYKSKIIFDSHEIFLEGSRFHNATKLRQIIWQNLEKHVIRKVDKVIVTTDLRKKILEEKYEITNINVIRNCHNEVFLEKKYDLFRDEFLIDKTTPILLYQGGLTSVRGIFTMVDVVSELNDISLIFMGMGRDKKALTHYIKEKKLENRIFVKDAVLPGDLIKYTSSADIGLQLLHNVNRNHYSTISNKIFEYMAAGLAIIASDFPEIKKIIKGYHIGKVVNPDSEKDIRNAILEITSNKELIKKMKVNSRKAFRENTWEKEELKLKQIVNGLL